MKPGLPEADSGSSLSNARTTATQERIVIGRLGKKIAKLTKQRDHWRQRCENYAEVLNMHPALESNFRTWKERVAARERVRELEQRVMEQAMFIRQLDRAYPELNLSAAKTSPDEKEGGA